MSKILILGDTVCPYHPLDVMFPLSQALAEDDLVFTNDYGYFLRLAEFDLLILAIDAWSKEISSEQTAAFLAYLNQGGRVLSIHTGMSIQATPALASVHGAKFLGHPPYDKLLIEPKTGHPLTAGVDNFTINDEPYQFEVSDKLDIFAEYTFDGKTMPAAWQKPYGKGRLIYLMPGHDAGVLQNETYQRLIKNCVADLVGK
jgi:type 1 glutamine amidotransferase